MYNNVSLILSMWNNLFLDLKIIPVFWWTKPSTTSHYVIMKSGIGLSFHPTEKKVHSCQLWLIVQVLKPKWNFSLHHSSSLQMAVDGIDNASDFDAAVTSTDSLVTVDYSTTPCWLHWSVPMLRPVDWMYRKSIQFAQENGILRKKLSSVFSTSKWLIFQ